MAGGLSVCFLRLFCGLITWFWIYILDFGLLVLASFGLGWGYLLGVVLRVRFEFF